MKVKVSSYKDKKSKQKGKMHNGIQLGYGTSPKLELKHSQPCSLSVMSRQGREIGVLKSGTDIYTKNSNIKSLDYFVSRLSTHALRKRILAVILLNNFFDIYLHYSFFLPSFR